MDVPAVVVDFVAGQLGIADPSCVKRYTDRNKTRFDHAWEIQRACGLTLPTFGITGVRRESWDRRELLVTTQSPLYVARRQAGLGDLAL